jgi:hypothetical protein
MANSSLPHDTFQPIGTATVNAPAQVPFPPPRYSGVALALARYRARRIVEQRMRDQGVRVQYVSIAIIREQAQAYLEAHRQELLDQCAEIVQRDPKLRAMAEKDSEIVNASCASGTRLKASGGCWTALNHL